MNRLILERFHTHLQDHGRSRTIARDQVFLALHQAGRCHRRDLRRVPHLAAMDRVTLYRTTRFLLDIGAAHEFTNGAIELSDHFKQHHHHFVCTQCGREISFHDDALEQALTGVAAARHLQLQSHQIELAGLCSVCAQSTP